MEIISLKDIRKGIVAFSFLILPTILISIFFPLFFQNYVLTGPDLWELKKKNVPNSLIDSLQEIRQKEYFFKYKLINEVESKINSPELFQKYEKIISNQISKIEKPTNEYYFLIVLALFYGLIWVFSKKVFPHKLV